MSARTIYLAGVILLVGSLAIGQFAHAATPSDPPLGPSGLRKQPHRVYLPLVLSKWRPLEVGLVTDIAGINDKSFNNLAWQGILEAETQLGVIGKYLESQDQTDYIENMQQFVEEKQDLIITVGFRMGVDTANVARANPEADFAIVDYTYPDCWTGAEPGRDCGSETVIPNVRGLTFSTERAAFLAGYLAAGMTTTGKVGTFGGMKISPVTAFMVGYEQGVNYYNQQHGAKRTGAGLEDQSHSRRLRDRRVHRQFREYRGWSHLRRIFEESRCGRDFSGRGCGRPGGSPSL